MERPKGISASALVMLGFLLQESSSVHWPVSSGVAYYVATFVAYITLGVITIWSYWRGHNWARRVVIACSAFIVWALARANFRHLSLFRNVPLSLSVLIIVKLIFCAFMLCWLNTRTVQTFFGVPKTERPRNRFLNALQQVGIWGLAVLLLVIGILLGGGSTILRHGLSRVGLLVLNTAGPLMLACLLVGIYYRVREDRRTPRRFVFFVAAWTFAFGLWIIARQGPLWTWVRYHGLVLTRDRQLQYAKAREDRRVQIAYNSAEEWHLWETKVAEDFGPASPLLAVSLEDTANLYRDHGQYSKAEPIYRRSLAVWDKAFGTETRFAAKTIEGLAQLYICESRYDEAEVLYRRALSIRDRALWPDDFELALNLERYSSLLHKMGRDDEAAKMEARAKAIRSKQSSHITNPQFRSLN